MTRLAPGAAATMAMVISILIWTRWGKEPEA